MAHNTIAQMRQILEALEQGKPIQAQTVNTDCPDEWDNSTSNTPNFFAFRYRIKPDEPQKKWRPFKDVNEFIKAAGGLGAIWLKEKYSNSAFLIFGYTNDLLLINNSWANFGFVLKIYTFLDGTPCGVEEDA